MRPTLLGSIQPKEPRRCVCGAVAQHLVTRWTLRTRLGVHAVGHTFLALAHATPASQPCTQLERFQQAVPGGSMKTPHRKYGEGKDARVYVDVPSLDTARSNAFDTEATRAIRTAAYVEAVEPSGRALVVKDSRGVSGAVLAQSTEGRARA